MNISLLRESDLLSSQINVHQIKSIDVIIYIGTGSNDEDLEFYIRECGQILGISKQLPEESRSAKHILVHILSHIVIYKRQNQV